ncbi:MAG: AIR synthase-related protein, partial [Pseudomonadota bacterium]
ERGSLLPKETIAPGDVIIALPSSGLHSNGFSLVRKIVGEGGFDLHEPAPFDKEQTLGQALLEPTKLYVTAALAVHNAGLAKAFAHITGGGLTENLPRVLPDGQGAHLDAHSWPCPPVFTWLARTAGLTPDDMIETFNCGVGMTIVVDGNDADAAQNLLSQNGMAASVIGSVTQDPDGRVQVAHIDKLIG